MLWRGANHARGRSVAYILVPWPEPSAGGRCGQVHPDTQTRPGAEDQWPGGVRCAPRPALPLPDTLHGPAPHSILRQGAARFATAGCRDGHHQRARSRSERGEYVVTLQARNPQGAATRRFKIVVGDTLALTPPMGWNDWYTHYDRITDKLMRQAADAMISSGMADFGYQYVNIDDCWMIKPGSKDPALGGEPRDAAGAIRPNGRFPDMKALTDYIHAKGLKAGIYTSPGPLTCGEVHGVVPARGDRRSQVRRVGLRFPEIRLVLLHERGRRQDARRSASGRTS